MFPTVTYICDKRQLFQVLCDAFPVSLHERLMSSPGTRSPGDLDVQITICSAETRKTACATRCRSHKLQNNITAESVRACTLDLPQKIRQHCRLCSATDPGFRIANFHNIPRETLHRFRCQLRRVQPIARTLSMQLHYFRPRGQPLLLTWLRSMHDFSQYQGLFFPTRQTKLKKDVTSGGEWCAQKHQPSTGRTCPFLATHSAIQSRLQPLGFRACPRFRHCATTEHGPKLQTTRSTGLLLAGSALDKDPVVGLVQCRSVPGKQTCKL